MKPIHYKKPDNRVIHRFLQRICWNNLTNIDKLNNLTLSFRSSISKKRFYREYFKIIWYRYWFDEQFYHYLSLSLSLSLVLSLSLSLTLSLLLSLPLTLSLFLSLSLSLPLPNIEKSSYCKEYSLSHKNSITASPVIFQVHLILDHFTDSKIP